MPKRSGHPRSRYTERYGAELTGIGLRAMERRLHGGEGMLLRCNPDGAEVRVIHHEGRLVVVVYDKPSCQIKTFLPADAPFAAASRRCARKGGDGC